MAYTNFASDDIIKGNVVQGVTSTAFSEGVGSLANIYTSSVQTASAGGQYFWDIYNANPDSDTTAEPQFSIAYGHFKGSGSARQVGASAGNQPTKAVYSQFRNFLLDDPKDTKAFTDGEGNGSGGYYFISVNRARYKQGVNAGNWELHLSASAGRYSSGSTRGSAVKLIDDSTVSDGDIVNGHLMYNIVSGSETGGVASVGGNTHHWGMFYPELGIFLLSANKLRHGTGVGPNGTDGLGITHPGSSNTFDEHQGDLFELIRKGGYFAMRSEEDVSSTHYFVRAKNQEYNYSTNHTYQRTGSNGEINGQLLHNSFIQNPQTFITTVGLYNTQNELLAIAKLSKPLLKNFERETTLRVKLDH